MSTRLAAAHVVERPATPLDEGLFRRLFIADRLPGFIASGLAPAAAQALVTDQFRLQTIGYGQAFPNADHRVILWRDRAVGRVIEATEGDHLLLIDLLLDPDHQGLGIGSEIVRRLQARAQLARRPVELDAIIGSRAVGVYERLGFCVIGTNDDRARMRSVSA